MKKQPIIITSVLALSPLLLTIWGCATRGEIRRFQEDTRVIQEQLRQVQLEERQHNQMIRAQLDSLRLIITQIRRDTQDQTETIWDMRASLSTKLEQLEERTQIIEQRLQESDYRFSSLGQKLDRVRLQMSTPQDSLTAPVDTGETAALDQIDPRQLYDQAQLDRTQGNYDLAILAFQEYLNRFPDNELADNAQYWLGECYYAKQDYERAWQEFSRVLENYPNGNKVPAALLKKGYAELALGKRQEAINHLNVLIETYPLSQEATLARTRLKKIQSQRTSPKKPF